MTGADELGPEAGAPEGPFALAKAQVPRRAGEARKAWRDRVQAFVSKRVPKEDRRAGAARAVRLKE